MTGKEQNINLEELFLTNNVEYVIANKHNINWIPSQTSNNAIIWISEKLNSTLIIELIFEKFPADIEMYRESITYLWNKLETRTIQYVMNNLWLSYNIGAWGLIPKPDKSIVYDWLNSGETALRETLDTSCYIYIAHLPNKKMAMVYKGIINGGIMQINLDDLITWFVENYKPQGLYKLLAVQPAWYIAINYSFIRHNGFKQELEKIIDVEKMVAQYAGMENCTESTLQKLICKYKTPNWDMSGEMWQNTKFSTDVLTLDYTAWDQTKPPELEKWDAMPIEHLYKYTFVKNVPPVYLHHLISQNHRDRFIGLDKIHPIAKYHLKLTFENYIWIYQTLNSWVWFDDMDEKNAHWIMENFVENRLYILLKIFQNWGYYKFIEFYQLYPNVDTEELDAEDTVLSAIVLYIDGDDRLLKYLHLAENNLRDELDQHTQNWLPSVYHCRLFRYGINEETKLMMAQKYMNSCHRDEFCREYTRLSKLVLEN